MRLRNGVAGVAERLAALAAELHPGSVTQGMTDNLFNLNQGWKNFE